MMRQSTFRKQTFINDRFQVLNYLGMNDYCECYRVIDREQQVYFLKFISTTQALKIDMASLAKSLDQANQWKSDHLMHNSTLYECESSHPGFYFLVDFVSGESLRELLFRESTLSLHQASQFALDLVQCLVQLKQSSGAVASMTVSPDNVFIHYDDLLLRAYWQPVLVSQHLVSSGLQHPNPINLAYGDFNQQATEPSAIYSITTLLYRCLNGHFPYNYHIDWQDSSLSDIKAHIALIRQSQPPRLSSKQATRMSPKLQELFDRVFSHAITQANHLQQQLVHIQNNLFDFSLNQADKTFELPQATAEREKSDTKAVSGFSAVAGLKDLKRLLQKDIIAPLKEKELYHSYGISPLNGMLLYWPPGCGKTFLAQKLAEELAYFYLEIKPSDIASTYVHGTQEKIGRLFRRAKANAPSLIFIDEVDAILPDRETHADNNHYAAEVNEFLAQMTNCSEQGIFIIAATNRPEMIDRAILRTGRLDKLIYMGLPDFTARYEMFTLLLKNRPTHALDFNRFALSTDGYVSSDLAAMVNEAAMLAFEKREPISNLHLDTVRSVLRPSVSQY